MLGQTTLPKAALEMLRSESQRLWRRADSAAVAGSVAIDLEPVYWALSKMWDGAVEGGAGSTMERTSVEAEARRYLIEALFMDEGGDRMVDPHHQLALEQQTELVVTVLESAVRMNEELPDGRQVMSHVMGN